jgi:hypothetical protein
MGDLIFKCIIKTTSGYLIGYYENVRTTNIKYMLIDASFNLVDADHKRSDDDKYIEDARYFSEFYFKIEKVRATNAVEDDEINLNFTINGIFFEKYTISFVRKQNTGCTLIVKSPLGERTYE